MNTCDVAKQQVPGPKKRSAEGFRRSTVVPATHPTTNILLFYCIFYLVFAKCKKVFITVRGIALTNSGSSLVAQVYNF